MNAQFWMGIALGGVVMLLLIMGIVWGGGRQNAKRAKDFNALSLEELKSRNGIGRMQVSALQVIGQALINQQETAEECRDLLKSGLVTDEKPVGITMKVYKNTPEHSALLEARFPSGKAHSQNKLSLTREDQKRLKLWADHLLDCIEAPPEPNCSCHISPPCSDCVDHGSLREAITETKAAIEAINRRVEQ